MGSTIERLLKEVKKGEKVLLNITTDGGDTEGFGEYRDLPETLKRVQDKNGFTITFVGTAPDVQNAQYKLNISSSNTMVHDNTAYGMKMSMSETMSSRRLYSTRVAKGLSVKGNFYKKTGN